MYQGKYQSATAPKPQSKTKPKTRRSKVGTIVFYSIYACLILAFVVGMSIAMSALNEFLVNYEASQPEGKSQQVFDQLFADPDWAELYTMAGIQDTAYENKEHYALYMEEKTAGQELTYLETSAGIDRTKKKYNVKAGTEKVATFTLTDTSGGKAEVPDWQLDTVEVFFTREQHCTVLMPPECTAYINGVALEERHVIRTVSTTAESYLPEGVHGYQMAELYIDGLLVSPTVTIQDANGTDLELSQEGSTYSWVPSSATEIEDDLYQALVRSAQTYCKYMIGAADKSALRSCFDADSQTYQTIVSNETWMQSYSGYELGEETVSGYYRYTDDLCSARVKLTMNVTRKDGTVKPYELDSTFFLTRSGDDWMVTEMTNVDVQEQITQVRLTFLNNGEELESQMVNAHSATLTPPAVTAPEGQIFTGWYYETVDDSGNKTMTLAFLPDENGKVSLGGTTLEPMTLYALFESEAP